ncbi:MAG: PASTA domain-containing protein [Planctomycetaceae bacterium]
MMTNSLRRWIGPVLLLGLFCLVPEPGFGQNKPRPAPNQQPVRSTRQPAPAGNANAKPAANAKPVPRRQREQLPPIDPRLEAFLQNWEKYTKGITSLEGRHTRFTYDYTWNIEKRAVGKFYYKAPDHGRIDLEPDNRITEGETKKVDNKTFKVEPADPEMWISNGTEIIQVHVKDKTFSRIPLPEDIQGKNIMDGPLPFLFGMPANVAKVRYDMQLLEVNEEAKTVWVKVKPLWQADAANYSEATLIISTVTYLPYAVKLVHPGGNEQTVYKFEQLDINKKPKLFEVVLGVKDPFNPSLRSYRELQNAELDARQEQGKNGGIQRVKGEDVPLPKAPKAKPGTVPDLRGMHWKKAELILKTAGYDVKWYEGDPAGFKEQVHTAYDQLPKPGQELKPGKIVHVKTYTEIRASTKPSDAGK